jgi:hypothetical protein
LAPDRGAPGEDPTVVIRSEEEGRRRGRCNCPPVDPGVKQGIPGAGRFSCGRPEHHGSRGAFSSGSTRSTPAALLSFSTRGFTVVPATIEQGGSEAGLIGPGVSTMSRPPDGRGDLPAPAPRESTPPGSRTRLRGSRGQMLTTVENPLFPDGKEADLDSDTNITAILASEARVYTEEVWEAFERRNLPTLHERPQKSSPTPPDSPPQRSTPSGAAGKASSSLVTNHLYLSQALCPPI